MPDPITWYALNKKVLDTTTIEQAIDSKLLEHNQDVGAHGENSEAIYEHRSDEAFDHPAYSIYTLKLSPYDRVYKAIVGDVSVGAFATVQEAIDYTDLHGGGKIFVKAGIHDQVDSIVLKDNIEIIGEGIGITVFNFTVADKNLKVVGVFRDNIEDSYSITSGTKMVTGVNGDWLSTIYAGDTVTLNSVDYLIASVDSNNQVTLVDTYTGESIVNALSLRAVLYVVNVKLRDFEVTGCTGALMSGKTGIWIYLVKNITVDMVFSRGNAGQGFYIASVRDSFLSSLESSNNGYNGFLINLFGGSVALNCVADSNVVNGFSIENPSDDTVRLISCEAHHNGYSGFLVNFSSYTRLISCTSNRNSDSGFVLYHCYYSSVVDCLARLNSEYGVYVRTSSALKNSVIGNHLYENTLGNLLDEGTDTEIGHNMEI